MAQIRQMMTRMMELPQDPLNLVLLGINPFTIVSEGFAEDHDRKQRLCLMRNPNY